MIGLKSNEGMPYLLETYTQVELLTELVRLEDGGNIDVVETLAEFRDNDMMELLMTEPEPCHDESYAKQMMAYAICQHHFA